MLALDVELTQVLEDQRFQRELHRFLWTEPLVNEGVMDQGWSCRDHAAVIGQVALDAGATATVLHGKCMFVQGPGASGERPVGLGQLPEDAGQHSWLYIEDLGHVDLSPRLGRATEDWRPLPNRGVIASSWTPTPEAALVVTTGLDEYEEAIALASRAPRRVHAIYYVAGAEPFTSEIAEDGLCWANSPRSDLLQQLLVPPNAYVLLARHLVAVANGSRAAAGQGAPREAWAEVIAAPAS